MCKEKYFLLHKIRTRLVFNYFKNNTKGYLESMKNVYSAKKNPRASRALRWTLDPALLKLILFMQLCFAPLPNFPKTNFGPLAKILGPPLNYLITNYESSRDCRSQLVGLSFERPNLIKGLSLMIAKSMKSALQISMWILQILIRILWILMQILWISQILA